LNDIDLKFCGSELKFDTICSDKRKMKTLFEQNQVNTSPYINIFETDKKNLLQKIIQKNFDYPIIVKPSHLSTGLGITTKSIVYNPEDAIKQIDYLTKTI
jgi:D-alanine-D-alanine ligase-like ATP-grasp enzyme